MGLLHTDRLGESRSPKLILLMVVACIAPSCCVIVCVFAASYVLHVKYNSYSKKFFYFSLKGTSFTVNEENEGGL